MTKEFDVVVIGSGPGGYVAAIRAAQMQLTTAIVEQESRMGGTCLNRGCIPTKALLHDADVYQEVLHAKDHGILVEGAVTLDLAQVHRRKRRIVTKGAKGVQYLMKKNGIEVLTGHGRLDGPSKVAVEGKTGTELVEARHTILASGSSVKPLPGIPFDGERILSSDDILDIQAIPPHLVVLGAGAVGVEFASIFRRFGSEVTILELLDRPLPLEDRDLSEALRKSFQRQGITIQTGVRVEQAKASDDGGIEVNIRKEDGTIETIAGSHLLVSVGRKPNTDDLGLASTSIRLDRGFIEVDEAGRTAHRNVYAIGDIVATPMLAHVAGAEGKNAAETIAGREVTGIDPLRVPSCVYSDPEVASVGLTEEAALEAGYDVKVGRFATSVLAKAQILGDRDGFVKIVAEARYGELLGFHLFGKLATELVTIGTEALHAEEIEESFGRVIHPHPTLAEAIHEAALAVAGHAIHG